MEDSAVSHNSESLVITIHTTCPAATHRNLLRGITDALQYYVNSPDKNNDVQGLLTLLELQQILTPKEEELQKAFQ
jgi:hypothetical protein